MRKVAVLLSVCLMASVASAAPLEFFFSVSTGYTGDPFGAFDEGARVGDWNAPPPEYIGQEILTVDPGDTVYLWAKTGQSAGNPQGWDKWVSLHPQFGRYVGGTFVPSGLGLVEGGSAYNVPHMYGTGFRWEPGSIFDPTNPFPDELKLVAVTTTGMGEWALDNLTITIGTERYNLVAALQFADIGLEYDVFMSMGDAKHVNFYFGPDQPIDVYYGFGDDPLTNLDVDIPSAVRDLTVVPEPASLVLLALAGLALRRR